MIIMFSPLYHHTAVKSILSGESTFYENLQQTSELDEVGAIGEAYVLRKPTANFGTRTKCGAIGKAYVSRTGIQHGQHRGGNSPARRAVGRITRGRDPPYGSLAHSMHDLSRAIVAVGVRSVLQIISASSPPSDVEYTVCIAHIAPADFRLTLVLSSKVRFGIKPRPAFEVII